jgi:hypothetical protein
MKYTRIILQQHYSPTRKHVGYLEVVSVLRAIVILFGFATGPSSEEQREPDLPGSNGIKCQTTCPAFWHTNTKRSA